MKFINGIIAFFSLVKHFAAASWKYHSGRWFVFQDTPDWVLKALLDANPNTGDDGIMQEARMEWDRRYPPARQ